MCIRVIGNLELIPLSVRKLIAKAMLITRNNDKVFLNVAFAYTCEYFEILYIFFFLSFSFMYSKTYL